MKRLALLALLSLAACQNEAFVNANSSADEDTAKTDDVQSALNALPSVHVRETGAAGVPTFISGNLGSLKTSSAAQVTGASPDLQANLTMIAPVFRLSSHDLEHRGTVRDADGASHLRFAQKKNGLEVVGGDLLVHVASNGTIYAANGTARDGIALGSTPSINSASAEAAARAASRNVSGFSAAPGQLVYFNDENGRYSLAWKVVVTGEREQMPVRDFVYINAKSGELLATHPQIHSALNREVHNLNHGTSLPGPLARSEGGAASGESIVDANYALLGTVHSAYQTLFNRDSYDGAGAKLISSVHYSTNYVNAYWNSTQMVYGDGDGVNASNLALSLDVTAHELTHAVTERTAGLVYSGQSGGLNESYSDVLGNVVEAFRDGAVSANTWKVGEDVWTPATPGDALRYMNDPKLDGTSLDTFADFTSTIDVHYSSGISNLAFYLTCQGGQHPRGRTTNVVAGIGITKAQQIWYRALTVYLTANATFASARTATVQAAVDLYTQADADSVANAWAAVGVGSPVGGTGGGAGGGTGGGTTGGGAGGGTGGDVVLTNNTPVTGLSDASKAQKFFRIDVPAGQASLVVTLAGGTGDPDLYVRSGSRPTTSTYTCRSWVSGPAESCTIANPAAGSYFILVDAYTAYSGTTLKAVYTAAGGGGTPVLANGVPVTGLSGATGNVKTWKVTVAAGATIVVKTSGGTGDADLYVRQGAVPTTTTYTCRSIGSTTTESCTITNAVAGDYYVNLTAYATYSGTTIVATY
jgi:vibriolysin